MDRHFIATYEQAGDFEVVNVNGRIKKNGGNVASYFCTPDGLVIHAVGKNVRAYELLKEAEWALELHQRATDEAPRDINRQREIIEQAHLERLHTTPEEFYAAYQRYLPEAQQEYLRTVFRKHGDAPETPEATARREATKSMGGQRVHQILAAQPLPHYDDVRHKMFEKLADEKFNNNRSRVYAAAERLKLARQKNRPVLLVLYTERGRGKSPSNSGGWGHSAPATDQYDDRTKRLVTHTFGHPQVESALKPFVVVDLPLRELAALTNVTDLPMYEVSRRRGPVLVVARPDGEQVAEMSGIIRPEELSQQLWMAHAEQLAQEGKNTQALKLLRKLRRSPMKPAISKRVVEQSSRIQLNVVEQRIARGQTVEALRLLRRLKSSKASREIRHIASNRITQLTAAL